MDQTALRLQTADEQHDEIERERALNERVARLLVEVVDGEIGRKQIAWALQLDAGDLSRALAGQRNLRPDYRLLAYVLRHERGGRMARLMAEQGGYLPPQRPDRLTDAEYRARAEMVLRESGAVGSALRRQILGEQTEEQAEATLRAVGGK